MAAIMLLRPCKLLLPSGEFVLYRAGYHPEMPDDHANSWWVRAHSDNPPEPLPPQPGTPAYAQQQAEKQRAYELRRMVESQEVQATTDAAKESIRRRPSTRKSTAADFAAKIKEADDAKNTADDLTAKAVALPDGDPGKKAAVAAAEEAQQHARELRAQVNPPGGQNAA